MNLTNGSSDPRPAATVVLMRDGASGLEVLLTKRPEHLRFMGGATVFPGGAVAAADGSEEWEGASSRSRADASKTLGADAPKDALAFFIAALREAFEEVGLLLASGPADQMDRSVADDPERFRDRCIELGLVLATDALVPAGRWVTPLGSPIRFDTYFFVARAPEGWTPDPDPDEVADCFWMAPAEALVRLSSGGALMAPPTIEMLQRLDQFESVDSAVDAFAVEEGIGNPRVLSVRLSPLVHAVLAPNPGVMTGPGTNTYIVGTGPTVVVDPAVDDSDYVDEVMRVAGEVSAVIVTHRHPDHVGGVAEIAGRSGAVVRAFGDAPAGGIDVRRLGDSESVEIGGARLVALHTPGHASDHLCLYLEGAASLFAGDNILGEGTAVIAPPDGNMGEYMASLRRLRELHIDRIYPGHFKPLDGGRSVIDGYISHRRAREAAVLDALSGGPRTIPEIVAVVYTDTPPHLHPVAEYQVLGHLEMLETEGRVELKDAAWRRASLK